MFRAGRRRGRDPRARRMPAPDLAAAARAARSTLATAAASRYEFLTLEMAAAIAEFDDDTEIVKALAAAARQGQGRFEHVLQQASDDRAARAACAATRAALEAAGIPATEDRPAPRPCGSPPWAWPRRTTATAPAARPGCAWITRGPTPTRNPARPRPGAAGTTATRRRSRTATTAKPPSWTWARTPPATWPAASAATRAARSSTAPTPPATGTSRHPPPPPPGRGRRPGSPPRRPSGRRPNGGGS